MPYTVRSVQWQKWFELLFFSNKLSAYFIRQHRVDFAVFSEEGSGAETWTSLFPAAGETADIAEEMAARDSLRRLYRFDDSARPFPYGKALDQLIPLVIEDHVQKKSLPS